MPDLPVAAASRIGDGLVQSAIWHRDRCIWVGPALTGSRRGNPVWTHRPVGPELYDGTSGIAVFLAELARVTDDKEMRRTALGAIRQALDSMDKAGGPPLGTGLYAGKTGISLAAASVAASLDCARLRTEAERLAKAVTVIADGNPEFDVISGSAGTIVGLLALRWMLPDGDMLLAGAIRAGDRLLSQALSPGDGSIAWYSPERTEYAPLTGFSHGAAGAGYALFELWAASGENRFRVAAEQAFRYENQLFDKAHDNWPDLRYRDQQKRRTRSFQTYWCHGAPGIAMARLRAFQLTGDSTWKRDAETGLSTTEWIVQACAETGTGNYSLCHGLLGNCEVLAFGDDVLGTRRHDLVAAVLVAGAGRCARGYALEGGTPYAATPGLLTGTAGIGYAFLRAGGRGIRSILNPAAHGTCVAEPAMRGRY